MKYMLILRGVSGSGKSTYAERCGLKFASLYSTVFNICSADRYFIKNGHYNFDSTKLSNAHNACKNQALKSVKASIPLIIIDNTNTTEKEMAYYKNLAQNYRYKVKEKTIGGTNKEDLETYAKRNQHQVDINTIQKQAQKLRG